MLKGLIEMALRGVVTDLKANPRGIVLRVCLRSADTGRWTKHEVASVDASTVGDVLRRKANARILEIELGRGTVFRIKLPGGEL